MELERTIYNKLVEITKRFKPNEASAILFDKNTLVIEAPTEDRSPAHFGIIDVVFVQALIDKYGYPSSLFHSHPGGASPSHRDLQYMSSTIPIWKCVWLIMSNRMEIRAWTISYGSDEFTGLKLTRPQRGETIYPVEIEVEIIG